MLRLTDGDRIYGRYDQFNGDPVYGYDVRAFNIGYFRRIGAHSRLGIDYQFKDRVTANDDSLNSRLQIIWNVEDDVGVRGSGSCSAGSPRCWWARSSRVTAATSPLGQLAIAGSLARGQRRRNPEGRQCGRQSRASGGRCHRPPRSGHGDRHHHG